METLAEYTIHFFTLAFIILLLIVLFQSEEPGAGGVDSQTNKHNN